MSRQRRGNGAETVIITFFGLYFTPRIIPRKRENRKLLLDPIAVYEGRQGS
jgi:hypothetical protein